MPAFDVLPVCDKEHPWSVVEDSRGMRGQRFFRVAHHDPLMAIKYGAGLPAQGEAWDASEAPSLTVVRRRPTFMGGITQASPARVGWCEVVVEYETPQGGGTIVPPLLGKKWSEWHPQAMSETVYFRLQDGVGVDAPINNGDGYARRVGVLELMISKYISKLDNVDWQRMNTLMKDAALNDEVVTAPPILGHGQNIVIAARTAQYMGYEYRVVGDFLLVEQTLMVGMSATLIWDIKNDRGERADQQSYAQIYPYASFAGLW